MQRRTDNNAVLAPDPTASIRIRSTAGVARPWRTVVVAGALALTSMVPVAHAAGAATLWTDGGRGGRPLVQVPSVAPLVARVEPAVLVIFTEVPASAVSEGRPHLPPGHPPLGDGSGPPTPFPMPEGSGGRDDELVEGQGAGFLITADGYALTNHHVVEDAVRVRVSVGESHEIIEADVVGSDEKSDVALIKLRSARTNWPIVKLADSDALKVGDFVVAIGSPFGLEQSVSLGIISARGRRDIAPSGRQGLYDFLQTDASINPGNSGGPLLDVYGAVVGINSAVNAAGSGIGFAIPINQVKRMLPSLKETGRFERSWMGVSIQSVRPELVRALGLTAPEGAIVREVVDGGPAQKADLQPGDVIVRFDGHVVRDANELPLLAGDAGVDATVDVEIVRRGARQKQRITLGSHPENAVRRVPRVPEPAESAGAAGAAGEPEKPPVGLSILNTRPEERARLSLEAGVGGARITRVQPASAAARAGLIDDDVVISVDDAPVKSAEGLAAIVKKAPSGAVLRLLVRRGPSTVFAALVIP